MNKLIALPAIYPIGTYFRGWDGHISRTDKKPVRIEALSRWWKYASEDVFELLFVGDMIRIREHGETDRGILMEIENKDDLEYYRSQEVYEILEILTLDRSAKATRWTVQWSNTKHKIEWLGDGTND